MIRHIRISNFAVIENVEIDFHDGLNIITGETGAGKSIVIEAVSLALGSRADTAFIRSGREKAVIQMIADSPEGEEYIITREISEGSRNICRINGEIVTLAQLNSLCRKLADIHGQYDHQSLLDPDSHIVLLDRFGSETIREAADRTARLYSLYSDAKAELKKLSDAAAKSAREKDFMAFELQELTDANLREGEDDQLSEEIAVLQNSETIYADLAGACGLISEQDGSLLEGLHRASDLTEDAGSFSADLDELAQRLSSLYYELEDIGSELRRQRDRVVFSPERLDECIARLDQLNRLKQKHGKSTEELIEYREALSEKLAVLDDISGEKARLEAQLETRREELAGACGELSKKRHEAAALLEEQISLQLSQLNFSKSDFAVSFRTSDTFTENGTDIVEFMISANTGEPLKPLSKIASGGEMSRIMLAFKKVTCDYDNIPTMIFDEIDAGISGIAASVVGRKLMEIAESHQVICITHLPQIAAFGKHHFRIEKSSTDEATYTTVSELPDEERTEEIARLLGGANVTDTTRKSARELIEASAGN